MQSQSKAKTAAFLGLYLALAVIMGYVEYRIPFHFGIPGVKLGLSNIVIVFVLVTMGYFPALLVSVLRVVIIAMLFGSPLSALYGFAGTLVSLGLMALLKKSGKFSLVGISAAGGAAHEVGQVLVAALVIKSSAIFGYLPVLLIAGEITGALIGLLLTLLLRVIKKVPAEGTAA